MSSNSTNEIRGKVLSASVKIPAKGLKMNDLKVVRSFYPLEEHEFNFLNSNSLSTFAEWTRIFYHMAIGFVVVVLAKGKYIYEEISENRGAAIDPKILPKWELYSVLFAFIAGSACLGLSKWMPGEKEKLISSIKLFFKANS